MDKKHEEAFEVQVLSVHNVFAGDSDRMRLDVLAANGSVTRLGHDFIVRGTQAEHDEHVARAQHYAEQHFCTVWVVNVVFTDGTFQKRVKLPLAAPDTKACLFLCCAVCKFKVTCRPETVVPFLHNHRFENAASIETNPGKRL